MKFDLSRHRSWLASALLLPAISAVAQLPNVPNAWQINDNSTVGGSTLHYLTNLTTAQFTAATNNGWRFTVTSRLLTNYASASPAMFVIFGAGTVRFGYGLNLDASGRLVLNPLGAAQMLLTPDAGTATNYHTHEMEYVPATQQVTYRFNGAVLATWAAQASTGQPRQPTWGSNSSADRGQMNFKAVDFEIIGQGVIARYDAGMAGNPAVAPNPATRGWTRSTGTAVTEGAVSPDALALPLLSNAWQINDNLATSGTLQYLTNLNANQAANANSGWRYLTESRLVSDSPDAGPHGMAFGNGTRRFYIQFDLDAAGQLTVGLLGDAIYTLTSATEATNYHTHEMTYDPVTGNAIYLFDGAAVAAWAGQVSSGQSNQVMWGANASSGQGVMNYRRARFEITVLGVIARYDAGSQGNPGVAPSPARQGWSRFANGSALPERPLSPDTVGFPQPMTPAVVLTQPATGVVPKAATLNATLNSDGLDTAYYWEYGTTTNYGNFTPTNLISGSVTATNVSAAISGLAAGAGHHFRAMGSNAAGVFPGQNLIFLTPTYHSIPIFNGSKAAWGDYDNDGRLDILVGGGFATEIWRNTGSSFSYVNVALPGLDGYPVKPVVAWCDYDNDGRLDVFLSRVVTGGIQTAQIWRNTGNGFTNINAGLPGLYDGAAVWGDYDNDGRPDLLLTGQDNQGAMYSQIWRNTGDGFVNINAGLPGVRFGTAAWGDYDNDGWLDILLTGYTKTYAATPSTQIWRNTGAGFTNINAGLPGVENGTVAWGDYDNDGWLDILLCGETDYDNGSGYPILISQVWRNTGAGFTNINAGLPGVYHSSAAWGDYDNDGRLDILLGGDSLLYLSQIYRNTGSGFVNVANFPGITDGSAAWGDADNDGRLDMLLAHSSFTRIHMNTQPATNTVPSPPTNLTAILEFPKVRLAWNAASDNETPAAGLTYNLRVGTTPGGADVVAPQADAAGLRRIPAPGNQQSGTNAFLFLTSGTYYWSVQAVDAALAGSAFAVEGSFSVPALPIALTLQATQLEPYTAALNGFVNPNGLAASYYFEHGLTTNYGSFTATNSLPAGTATLAVSDTISGLVPGGTYHFRVVASNATGVVWGEDQPLVTPHASTTGLPQEAAIAAAWGDSDRDGRLDLLISASTTGVEYSAGVWRNTGNGFSNFSPGFAYGFGNAVAWGDYNNDGWLDALRTLQSPAGFGEPARIELWRNDGNSFTQVNLTITALGSGSLAWGDFDNDGRKDVLVTGRPNTFNNPSSQIWRHTGGGFTNINAGLPGVWDGDAHWCDFDRDGWLDLILTGATNSGATGGTCQLWRNIGAGFTNVNLALPALYHSSVAWGDYDQDGWPDLLLAGSTNGTASGAVAQVWRNTGGGFTNVNAGLPGVYLGAVAWGDYDNDGRVDILLLGKTNDSPPGAITGIWRNMGTGFTNLNLGMPGLYGAWDNGDTFGVTAGFGDYENDGRLDVLLAGTDESGDNFCGVWLNDSPLSNSVPAAPAGLAVTLLGGIVQFHWNPATDNETPSAGLSYNLRVGTAPGNGNVVAPDSEPTGFRLLSALGNAQFRTNAFLKLEPGTYYWSVQAVDSAFAGGPFAAEAILVVPSPALSILPSGTNIVISWQPSYPGWILQEAMSLAPVVWSNSPSGATNPVVVPATLPMKFYRLFKL